MPRAKIDIEIPDEIWTSHVTSKYPGAEFHVRSAQPSTNGAVVLVGIEADDYVPIISEIRDYGGVSSVNLLRKNEDGAIVEVEIENPVPLKPIFQVGIPLKTPFIVADGTARWEVTTSRDKVSTLTERLDSAEVQYIIRSIHSLDETEADRLLTDRQIEVLRTASEMGYYSMPREVTQKEVADRLGVTKATCNTLLQRVESSVFGWFVSEHV